MELLELERNPLRKGPSDRLTPDYLADYLEVRQNQYLELLRQSPRKRDEPGG